LRYKTRSIFLFTATILLYSITSWSNDGAEKSITPIINLLFSAEKKKVITLDELKAFPTAEGAGACASGGRGGKVIYVINRPYKRIKTTANN